MGEKEGKNCATGNAAHIKITCKMNDNPSCIDESSSKSSNRALAIIFTGGPPGKIMILYYNFELLLICLSIRIYSIGFFNFFHIFSILRFVVDVRYHNRIKKSNGIDEGEKSHIGMELKKKNQREIREMNCAIEK